MTKSAYDELVERCQLAAKIASHGYSQPSSEAVEAILAEIARTLENVTPEMRAAWMYADGEQCVGEWLAMLTPSPLFPPDPEWPARTARAALSPKT
jgi:hypothetical protein